MTLAVGNIRLFFCDLFIIIFNFLIFFFKKASYTGTTMPRNRPRFLPNPPSCIPSLRLDAPADKSRRSLEKRRRGPSCQTSSPNSPTCRADINSSKLRVPFQPYIHVVSRGTREREPCLHALLRILRLFKESSQSWPKRPGCS